LKNLAGAEGTIPSTFCDNDKVPAKMLTNSNKFDISFQSSNQPENHFWLTWSTVGKFMAQARVFRVDDKAQK